MIHRRPTGIALLSAVLAACAFAGCTGTPPAERFIARGDERFHFDNYEGAAEMYERAVESQPGKWEAHYKLGLAQLELGNYSDARRNLELAYSRRPGRDDIADALAESLYRLGQEDRLYTFLQDRARSTGEARDYLVLAEYAEELDDPDMARRSINTAIELDEGRSVEPYLFAADLAERLGDLDEAIRRLRQALSIDVRDERVRQRLRDLGEIPGPSIALPPGR